MTDRELLELAAKAADLDLRLNKRHPWGEVLERRVVPEPDEPFSKWLTWDPLTDDGDALRLANQLFLSIIHTDCSDSAPVVMVGDYMDREKLEQHPAFPDENAAVRRAIVIAAAEIGRAMQ